MSQQTAPATIPWPEGVIARYLTVGGATVDITLGAFDDDRYMEAVSACTGCPDQATRYEERNSIQDSDTARRRVEKRAREWAQSHAERCRAMPRPQQ